MTFLFDYFYIEYYLYCDTNESSRMIWRKKDVAPFYRQPVNMSGYKVNDFWTRVKNSCPVFNILSKC
jgi:hypothetical protein